MSVLRSDLRRVSLGCQLVSYDVIKAPGDVVKVATGVVTGCQEMTTEFREPSIDEGLESK